MPTMDAAGVRFAVLPTADDRAIAVATLNQPAALNALSLAMVQALQEQLSSWQQDAGIVAVWLDSSSERALCAGADLKSIHRSLREAKGVSRYARDFFAAEYRLDYMIHTYAKPIVAWMQGITMGGGIGLGCGASTRVVSEDSQFAMPEISIGLFPDVAASWFLGRVPGNLGRYLGMTGARLGPADAIFAGLADVPVPKAAKQQLLARLQRERWSGDHGSAFEVARRSTLALADWSIAQDSALAERFTRLSELCSVPTVKDLAAAVQDLAGEDPWAEPHARMLREGSPTSAVLAWELQARLRHASLAEVFKMEYAAALGCCDHDFAEGIRALIVDKDRAPRWQPATMAEVTAELIDDVLRPRWQGEHPLADIDLNECR